MRENSVEKTTSACAAQHAMDELVKNFVRKITPPPRLQRNETCRNMTRSRRRRGCHSTNNYRRRVEINRNEANSTSAYIASTTVQFTAVVCYVPSPSLSKRLKASLNSAICSSVSWSAMVIKEKESVRCCGRDGTIAAAGQWHWGVSKPKAFVSHWDLCRRDPR